MHPAENFGKQLKDARERKGVSQTLESTICSVRQSCAFASSARNGPKKRLAGFRITSRRCAMRTSQVGVDNES